MERARLRTALGVTGLSLLAACGGSAGAEDPAQAAQAATPAAPAAGRPSFLVVVLDTTRPDLLSVYGHPGHTTPYLERFAAEATRFDRAYSVSNWTLPSHASLFTGVLPRVHRATQTEKLLADSLPTLAEELGAAGYDTAGFSNNVWVTATTGLDRGFEHFEDLSPELQDHLRRLARDRKGTIDPLERHRTVMRVRAWLRRRAEAQDERPFFCFVNLIEPHMPYLPPWSAVEGDLSEPRERFQAIQEYFPGASPTHVLRRHYLGDEVYDDEDWGRMRTLYEGMLRVADGLVEKLVGAVDEAARSRDTVVVVLSDHGENIGDHGHVSHIFNLYDSNVRIPLLVRGPGFAPGAVAEQRVQILDLHPTLLALAGLDPRPGPGRDLRAAADPGRVLVLSMEQPDVTYTIFERDLLNRPDKRKVLAPFLSALSAAVGERWKLIRGADGAEELYDLLADPDERTPLDPASVDAAELVRLRDALEHGLGEPAPRLSETGGEATDPEVQKRLRAIGYAADEDE